MKFDPCDFITKKLAGYKDFASLKDMSPENCIIESLEAFSLYKLEEYTFQIMISILMIHLEKCLLGL